MNIDLNLESIKQEYLDIFEELYQTSCTQLNMMNSDIGTTYLEMSKMRKQDELMAYHKTLILEDLLLTGQVIVWY